MFLRGNRVILDFGTTLAFLAMTADQAEAFAKGLMDPRPVGESAMQDSSNRFLVRPQQMMGQQMIEIGRSPGTRLTRDDALNLACWLLATADPTREEFEPLFREVVG